MQKALYDQNLSTVILWVNDGKEPHCSVLQGQSRDTWVLWKNFESLKVKNDILFRSTEDSNTGQSHSQQIVPTTLRPKTLETIQFSNGYSPRSYKNSRKASK